MSYTFIFTHNFFYSSVDDDDELKPIIPISFKYQQYEYSYPMLIDSGSKVSSLGPEHAKALGIEDITVLPERHGFGIGGPTRYRVLEGVTIIIAEKEIEITAPIHFVENMQGLEFGVLGRKGIFNVLRIAFREHEGPYIFMALDSHIA
ncbi:MAG TPA: hypothetical protein DCZ10_11290 [Pelotomaculum sp.]|nr:hypothetical protein [Pelotomaculum sp.]